MAWRNVSSFRQRARNAEQITQQLKTEITQKLVKRTYDQMSAFDDHVRAVKEKAAREEAEEEAELIRLSEGWARARAVQFERLIQADTASEVSSTKSATGSMSRYRSDSVLPAHVRLDNSEILHAQRPPSPLHVHDYGGISVRPRSYQQQVRNRHGGPTRPAYRQEFCGVYFPGPDCKQGPYGTSMIEPCLMPPRCWVKGSEPPHRHPKDAADLRPRTAEGRDRPVRKGKADAVIQQHRQQTKSRVPTNNAHRSCTQHRAHCVRKRDQERFVEAVRFEQGHFEGRFADPLIKNSGYPNDEMLNETHAIGAEDSTPDGSPQLAWGLEAGETYEAMATHIFLGLHQAMREHHARLPHLFKPVNRGVPGVLEPAEFLEGLQRLRIVEKGQVSIQQLLEVMYELDPDFDGRIILSHVRKCIAATRALVNASQPGASENDLTNLLPADAYCQRVPVQRVVVERQPKSIWDFERSYEKFRNQQHELLIIHNERDSKVSPDMS
ncbi:unnamed protein product [Symbiodinium necroappetens]|uniref:Uncharacterized protein n=1 Tax=Symbiodinium necroappetens TaxID=1628268 RepID=A0A812P5F4_9DINO|nr:unnamed protein product [Symbiodinium necroappetens]